VPLKVNTTPALIGIETRNATLEIKQHKADLTMKREPLEMKIEKKDSEIQIDQSVCFSECGNKKIFDLIKHSAQMGKQKSMEAIGKISSEGNEMMRIENDGEPIKNIGVNNAFPKKDYNIGFIPKSRPKITATKAEHKIDFEGGKTNIDVKVNKPTINYNQGKVDIYLRQKPSINIEYVNDKI
jgi:hypothetical protein